MPGEAEIEKMVLKPAWKEMLLEMIASERLDPWNVDITALADGFLRKVRGMKTLDLHLPANVILAAAILLKYKSNAIRVIEEAQPLQEETWEAPAEDIPRLELVSRIPPKRPITLEDLMKEMERVMSYDAPQPPRPKPVEEVLTLPAPEFDIEERMDGVFARLKGKVDCEGWATFSALVESGTPEDTIYTLLPLLHLSQKKTVSLKQDEFFGEIFIRLNEKQANVVSG